MHLNAPGHPHVLRLSLPASVSSTGEGRQWLLVRVPTKELLQRLARWSDRSFPNLRKLAAVLSAIDAGQQLDAPVLVEHTVGHVFESGGHTALMLAQLGAATLPVVVRLGSPPPRPPRRSIRAFLRGLWSRHDAATRA